MALVAVDFKPDQFVDTGNAPLFDIATLKTRKIPEAAQWACWTTSRLADGAGYLADAAGYSERR
jgi:hypothetical protein